MKARDVCVVFLLCSLASVALVRGHTVAVCYKLDVCTGLYEAAYGTYHSISQFSNGCPGNPSSKCPSGHSIIDGNSVAFSSLVLAHPSTKLPNEPGWSLSDCFICPNYGTGINGVQVWQKATVTLSPGPHSVTLASTSQIEWPWSGCWPITLTVAPAATSNIFCPASQTVTQTAHPSCSAVVTYSSATCTVDAQCPGSTCSTALSAGSPPSGSNFNLGTTPVTWELSLDGNPTGESCTHNVIVEDNTAPQNIVCSNDVSAICTSPAGATATFPAATANDCNALTWTSTHTSGQNFPIGTTVVTFTANDGNGQTSSCNFNVNIGSGPPTWSQQCPTNMLVTSFTPGPSGTATVSWTEPTALDGCTNPLGVTRTGKGPGSSFDVMTENPTTISYLTHADPVTGQQLSCSFEISFGFAQITRVDQLSQTDVDTIYMYIPFEVTVQFVNIPVQSGNGHLWVSDGTTSLNLPHYVTDTMTFDTSVLTNEFLGAHQLMPGQMDLWVTVDGNPFYFGNQMTLTLVANSAFN